MLRFLFLASADPSSFHATRPTGSDRQVCEDGEEARHDESLAKCQCGRRQERDVILQKRYHSEIFNDVQEIVDCHDFFRYLFLINTTAFPPTTARRMSPRYGTLCKGLEVLGFRRKQQLADRKSAKDRAEPWMANRGRLRQEPIYYRAESVALLIHHTRSVPGTLRPHFHTLI